VIEYIQQLRINIFLSGISEWEDFYLPQRARLDFNISAFNKEDKILG
jgi:hypothetical protein